MYNVGAHCSRNLTQQTRHAIQAACILLTQPVPPGGCIGLECGCISPASRCGGFGLSFGGGARSRGSSLSSGPGVEVQALPRTLAGAAGKEEITLIKHHHSKHDPRAIPSQLFFFCSQTSTAALTSPLSTLPELRQSPFCTSSTILSLASSSRAMLQQQQQLLLMADCHVQLR